MIGKDTLLRLVAREGLLLEKKNDIVSRGIKLHLTCLTRYKVHPTSLFPKINANKS